MTSPVLVTGAAGAIGSVVMSRLASRGIPARGMTRGQLPQGGSSWVRADLVSGVGVTEALAGTSAVIHCASDFTSADNDIAAVEALISASKAAGGIRLVNVGIAGIERAAEALPYYATKLAVEQRLARSGVPHVKFRATQFFPFVDFLLGSCDNGTVLSLPNDVTLQPVSLEFVADRLIDCGLSSKTGPYPDVHGAASLTMEELGRAWLDARAKTREVVLAPAKDGLMLGFSKLERVDGHSGGETWAQWLAANAGRDNPYTQRFGGG